MALQLSTLWKKYFNSVNAIIRAALSLALVFFFIACETGMINVTFFRQLELQAYDTRLRFTMPRTVEDKVVIIDLDEKSLQAEGRWPWPRDKMAVLTRQAFDKYKLKVLGYDIVFSEPDETSGLKTLEQLANDALRGSSEFQSIMPKLRKDLDYDALFAETIKNYPVVLGFVGSSNIAASSKLQIGALPLPTFTSDTFKDPKSNRKRNIVAIELDGYSGNIKLLQENAANTGHLLPDLDQDGIIRRVPMLAKFKDGYYEALSLAMYRTYLDNAALIMDFDQRDQNWEHGPKGLKIGPTRIPVDFLTTALVPYRGESPKFKYISATDIIRGTLPENELVGKIAILGTSAQGLLDLRNTPVGAAYPGVEVHANLLSGMLNNTIKERSQYDGEIGAFMMFVTGLIMVLLLPRLSPLMATLMTIGLLAAIIGFNMYNWSAKNTVYSIAMPVLMTFVLYVFNMAYGFFAEARQKRQIVSKFGEYVPRELVAEMAQNPEGYSMAGETREMTVLFSDVRDFTTISESLPADQLEKMMNAYLTPMTEVVQGQRGTIDKYIGDAIMAFWGAPLPDDKHAEHGIKTALQMQKDIRKLDAPFKEKGWPALHIGVGLNCGKMSVGNMGSSFRRAYTVMGDAVNLGARLEGLTKEYGVGILVSENIVKAAPIAIYKELDKVRVKGKLEPVAIFEPIGLIGEVGESAVDEVDRFHKALAKYRAQQWDEAERLLTALAQAAPSTKVYKVYLERIANLRNESLSAEWDGVFVFKTK
ncbi:MAG: adenylate/guanylate cyclase domain-containing protein [Betaproteobacteria bacterium]|nr:adenylate/guanylate cyclase domain-containing protein [Betaproteobacteria bacterium]